MEGFWIRAVTYIWTPAAHSKLFTKSVLPSLAALFLQIRPAITSILESVSLPTPSYSHLPAEEINSPCYFCLQTWHSPPVRPASHTAYRAVPHLQQRSHNAAPVAGYTSHAVFRERYCFSSGRCLKSPTSSMDSLSSSTAKPDPRYRWEI